MNTRKTALHVHGIIKSGVILVLFIAHALIAIEITVWFMAHAMTWIIN
jgi:hypothetical protein